MATIFGKTVKLNLFSRDGEVVIEPSLTNQERFDKFIAALPELNLEQKDGWSLELTEKSWEQIESAIQTALRALPEAQAMPDEYGYFDRPWVVATYDNKAVYDFKGQYYEIAWTESTEAPGQVVLVGDPVEVQQVISYEKLLTQVNSLSESEIEDLEKHIQHRATQSGQRANGEPVAKQHQLSEFVWASPSEPADSLATLLAEGKPIQIMKPGSFTHPDPSIGEFDITLADMEEIANNFNNNVRKQEIPVDIDHIHEGGAVGWFKEVKVEDDKLMAVVNWTEEGENDLAAGRFKYFSPHFGPWQDPETNEEFRIVLMSGAITNFPFLKEMDPIELSEVQTKKGYKMTKEEEEAAAKAGGGGTESTPPKVPVPASEGATTIALTEQVATLQRQLAEREQATVALTEQVSKMAKDRLVMKLTDIVKGHSGGPRFIGDETKHISFLTSLSESFGEESEMVSDYISDQQAHAEQIKTSALFQETGTAAAGPTSSGSELETIAEKILSEGRAKSRPEALGIAASENPGLYARQDREVANRIKRGED